jgi:hypothetical protein
MSKEDRATVPRQNELEDLTTPGFILVAFTGIIGYTSPSLPIGDDMTLMAALLWLPQAFMTAVLIYTAGTRGRSTPSSTWSAAMVGFAAPLSYGMCWAQWGNVATYAFWMAAGVYFALGFETRFGIAGAVERRIGTMLDS